MVKRAGRRLEIRGTGPHRGEGMEPRGRFRNHPQCSLCVACRSPRSGQSEPYPFPSVLITIDDKAKQCYETEHITLTQLHFFFYKGISEASINVS